MLATGAKVATLRGTPTVSWAWHGRRAATAWPLHRGTRPLDLDPITGKERSVFRDVGFSLYCVSWSPDGKRLMAGGLNGAVQAGHGHGPAAGFASRHGRRRTASWSPDGGSVAAAGGPDGGSVAAAGEEGVTRVWDVRAGSDLVRASEQAGTAGRGFDWGLNGRTATRDYDGVVRVWERGASTPALTLQGGRIEPGQDPKHEVDFSPDGTKIAVGGPDLRVCVGTRPAERSSRPSVLPRATSSPPDGAPTAPESPAPGGGGRRCGR